MTAGWTNEPSLSWTFLYQTTSTITSLVRLKCLWMLLKCLAHSRSPSSDPFYTLSKLTKQLFIEEQRKGKRKKTRKSNRKQRSQERNNKWCLNGKKILLGTIIKRFKKKTKKNTTQKLPSQSGSVVECRPTNQKVTDRFRQDTCPDCGLNPQLRGMQ